MPTNSGSDLDAVRLHEVEQRLSGLLAMTTEAIVCADKDQRIVVFNRGAEEIFGYREEEILGAPLETLIPEHARGMHRAYVQGFVDRGEAPRRMSDRRAMVGRRKNGDMFDAEISISAVGLAGAGVVTAVVHDVSAFKAAERQFRHSEAVLRALVERAPFGIYRSTPDGRLLMANPALAEMLGYDSVQDLLSVTNMDALYQRLDERSQLVEHFSSRNEFKGVEVGWKRKDGTPLTVQLSGRPLRVSDRALVAFEVFVEDVTVRVGLERQRLQSQKMESVGRLAGGIAHDFNNLLSVILGWTEVVMSDLPEGHAVKPSLEEVLSAGQRAAGLTRQLLAFSRQQVVEPTIFSVNALVVEMDKMLRRLLHEDIELATHTDPHLGTVKMDRGQLEQVVMNVVVNARDAMPQGGTLRIETANVVLDADYPREHADVAPGDYVMIAVSDSGGGMSEEVKAHIFEPFFTTKENGKGTGLGLATSFGIVRQAGGDIAVHSEVGRGTTMRIYLPRHEETLVSAARRRRKTPMHGVETILLVEDEPAVRRVAVRLLEAQGYHVVSTSSGEEALRVIEDGREPIDLLLTDVVLAGGMSGPVLADRVRALKPELKVLFASGYTKDVTILKGLQEHTIALVQKPFTAESLGEKVRQVLDDGGQRDASVGNE
jgi:two-component system cell cycle sensor histidine kinase/response regulator CckA